MVKPKLRLAVDNGKVITEIDELEKKQKILIFNKIALQGKIIKLNRLSEKYIAEIDKIEKQLKKLRGKYNVERTIKSTGDSGSDRNKS